MSITYPLTLPSTPGFRGIIFTAEALIVKSASPFTFAEQRFAQPGERWKVQVDLPIMKRANADIWEAFILSLRHGYGNCYIGDPTRTTPRGTAAGSGRVMGANQVGNVVYLNYFTANQAKVFAAGDWLQLGSRLYRVLKDTSTDNNGATVVDIWPSIRAADSPSDGLAVVTANTKGIFELESSSVSLSPVTVGRSYVLPQLSFVEVLT